SSGDRGMDFSRDFGSGRGPRYFIDFGSGRGPGGPGFNPNDPRTDPRMAAAAAATTASRKPVSIAADERTNTVLVSGTAGDLAKARKILDTIDQGTKLIGPTGGDPIMQQYTVPAGAADAMVRLLEEQFKTSKFRAVGNNLILCLAPPHEQMEIAALIKGSSSMNTGGPVAEFIPLNTLEAKGA